MFYDKLKLCFECIFECYGNESFEVRVFWAFERSVGGDDGVNGFKYRLFDSDWFFFDYF